MSVLLSREVVEASLFEKVVQVFLVWRLFQWVLNVPPGSNKREEDEAGGTKNKARECGGGHFLFAWGSECLLLSDEMFVSQGEFLLVLLGKFRASGLETVGVEVDRFAENKNKRIWEWFTLRPNKRRGSKSEGQAVILSQKGEKKNGSKKRILPRSLAGASNRGSRDAGQQGCVLSAEETNLLCQEGCVRVDLLSGL